MHSLVAELIEGIENDEEEAFLGASEVAAASHFGFGKYQPLEPYDKLLASDPPGTEDVKALKDALIASIKSTPKPAASAAFALGKFYDPALAPLLREQLSRHLKGLIAYNAAISNLICALDNSGEEIITEGRHSLTDSEKIISDAREYLGKHGQFFPR